MFNFLKCLLPGSRSSSQDKGGKKPQYDESLASWVIDNGEEHETVYTVRDKHMGKLHKAVWYGNLDKVKKLLPKQDPNALDKCHRTPLHLACCKGYVSIVQELLAVNVQTGVGDKESKTPLMKAVECGHAGAVEILLSHGVDGDARLDGGDTPLHLAIKYHHTPIIIALLKAGVNPNIINKKGKTPLHYAILKHDLDITTILLKNNANVNEIDNKQRTALMVAAYFGLDRIINLLLLNGAKIAAKDGEGLSASDHAKAKDHKACYMLLKKEELREENDEDSIGSPHGIRNNVKGKNRKVPPDTSSGIPSGTFPSKSTNIGPTETTAENLTNTEDEESDWDRGPVAPAQPIPKSEENKETEKSKEVVELKSPAQVLLEAEIEKNRALQREMDTQKQKALMEFTECNTLKRKIGDLESKLKYTESTLKRQTIQLADAQQNRDRFTQENDVHLISLQDQKEYLEKEVHILAKKNAALESDLHCEKAQVDMLEDLEHNNHRTLVQLKNNNARLIVELRLEKEKSTLLQQHLFEEQNVRYKLYDKLSEATLQLEDEMVVVPLNEESTRLNVVLRRLQWKLLEMWAPEED